MIAIKIHLPIGIEYFIVINTLEIQQEDSLIRLSSGSILALRALKLF
jgi:hypothetical protein